MLADVLIRSRLMMNTIHAYNSYAYGESIERAALRCAALRCVAIRAIISLFTKREMTDDCGRDFIVFTAEVRCIELALSLSCINRLPCGHINQRILHTTVIVGILKDGNFR